MGDLDVPIESRGVGKARLSDVGLVEDLGGGRGQGAGVRRCEICVCGSGRGRRVEGRKGGGEEREGEGVRGRGDDAWERCTLMLLTPQSPTLPVRCNTCATR